MKNDVLELSQDDMVIVVPESSLGDEENYPREEYLAVQREVLKFLGEIDGLTIPKGIRDLMQGQVRLAGITELKQFVCLIGQNEDGGFIVEDLRYGRPGSETSGRANRGESGDAGAGEDQSRDTPETEGA